LISQKEEKGERKMKKAFTMIVIGLLCVSMLSILTPKVMGWASSIPQTLHEDMAYDALRNSGWSVADAAQIALNTWGGVTTFPIEEYTDYYHRLNEYQTELHNWHLNLGEDCQCDDQGKNGGAEDGAYHYIQQARLFYISGNKADALKNLGYAIHFIQDSVCPPHVFPFSEHVTHTAALDFEIYTANEYYSLLNNWDSRVKNAVEEPIGSAEDLCQKVIDAAHEERSTFEPPHPGFGYVREDGTTIGDLSWTIRGWKMSSEDIGWCMEKAASLVKGAAIYVRDGAQGTTKEIPGLVLHGQDTQKSCWAASSQMILDFYGTYGPSVSQLQIAREVGSEYYYDNGLSPLLIETWKGALNRLGKVRMNSELSLTFEQVKSDIDLNRPIIGLYAGDLWIIPNIVAYHAVVIAGYVDNPGETNDRVKIYDPWPSDDMTFPSLGRTYEESWSSVKDKLYSFTNALRTNSQIAKSEISVQIIEGRSSGILRFIVSSDTWAPWWTEVGKWNKGILETWSSIPGLPDQVGTGTRTVDVDIDQNGLGNYRLHVSATLLQEPVWSVRAFQTNELADAIVVDSDSLLMTWTNGDPRAFHVFTSPVGFLSSTDGETFAIMSTGIAANTPGSPEHFESTDFGSGGTADDTVYLTLRFLVPDGATTLSFDFRFMSEEYPEYVGTMFNDFFYAYLMDSTGTHQVAFDDNGNIINVNNNFFNPNIYPIGTVFDGTTKRLTTTVNVNAGETITLQFVVGDAGDGIYDTAVFLDNVRFNVGGGGPGTTPTADVIVVKNGPNSVEQGKQFTYTINYFNIEEAAAQNVVVTDNLASQVAFVSASAGGTYSSIAQSVTWNLGTLQPFSSGAVTLTISVPSTVPIGTVLQNSASIATTSQESNSNNNQHTKPTTVTAGTSLPPNVEVSPVISNYNGIPVLYWTTPTTFSYHGDATVVGVDINIHLPDGGPDIGGPMTNTLGTYNWIFTYTFYPRHGQGTVTYTVHYTDGHESTAAHSILVDPSGYVYNAITGQRIEGATVTLYRFNIALQQFVLIAPNDPGIEPHINPQITDENGGYGWMVSPGMYMVDAEKTGYAANFAIVTVPPAATDLNIALTPIDADPPTTHILIGEPHYIDASGNTYVTSATSFTLIADDGPDGSGVAATYYRQYNATQNSNWKEQPNPFYMTGLDDGNYSIDYYSTDVAGNVEPTNTQNITLDNTAPLLTIETPQVNDALQDGVTFKVSAWDLSAVASITFSIQCPQGNTISPEFQSMPATLGAYGKWSLYFDTRKLPDGFYLFEANGTDVLGNWGTITVQFSIRNWATIQMLPSTPNSKAGRTMPIKFSIRVKASVDPAQPFIYNEELTIKIYKIASPSNLLLQTSTFGSDSTNYRIDTGTLYITNFKTQSTPATYLVNIYRKGMLIGSFQFSAVK
jgi:uncharacterized repeat protein (TIGR01451 family)